METRADFKYERNQWINSQLFGNHKKSFQLSKIIRNYKSILASRLKIFIDSYNLDLLVVENALAIPMHIPLGLALTDVISATGIPTIAHHHDFYWERDRFAVTCVKDYLDMAFPCKGDNIRHVVAGAHRVVFVTRGSLYLVAVSSSGESVPHLARQLHCLHAQIISILTSKVEAIFQRNASFDLRGLLGGTDRVLRSLIREGSGQPTMLLGATPCLRMPAPTRAELGRLLAATRPTSLLFGVLLARGFLVQLWRTKKTPLHPQVRGGAGDSRRRTGRS